MAINYKKCYYILFADRKTKKELKLLINQNVVNKTDSLKILGIYFDDKLSFPTHIEYVCKKVKRNIGLLYRIRNFLKYQGMREIYFILFYHFLIYGLCVWGFAKEHHLNRIRLIQKKIIRIMSFKSYNCHTLELFENFNVLQFDKLIKMNVCKTIFKAINNQGSNILSGFF
ncbi:RNA-directed DNA polymerase from mobile element jockey-like protein [Dinothrombium tinctorium]|uniref:RNA-directed DNA polymerase from mobile element jockey-like protein n=1 Tax=Dinothrombium tinctorium TaxID=1965070 RepID=A0A3S4QMM2_9ACAR|nr:RNA-directed DNA polymerase from mobile element jockey-like protein [Dinothrombium tinctorium]